MAKEITYRCNLCAYRSIEASQFIGIHYGAGKSIELTAAIKDNNHLCCDCVKALKSAFGFAER